MDVNDLVDAALAGFDKGETITIPPLHDENLWQTLEDARKSMLPYLMNEQAAPRYQA
jgi:short-subunit dehydrogenase